MINLLLKKHRYPLLVALVAAAPGPAFSQILPEEDEDKPAFTFGGNIYIEGRYVQNASRTPVENNEIDEVQTTYGANINTALSREIVTLAADYNFYQNEFSEGTQQDRFIRTGRSSFILGTDTTFYQLTAAHSTQRFLLDPSGPAILSNTDQRDITTVSPLLRLRPGSLNSIEIAGHFADIRYKELDINDSERLGFGVDWYRRMSPIYTFGVRYMENEVEYVNVNTANYRYRRAAISFEAELRLLNYTLELGGNEALPDQGGKFDGLYFDFTAVYGRHRNSWAFTARQNITDTSIGNANDPFFSEGITSDVSNLIQDQLERSSYGLLWRSDFLCGLCDLSLRTGYERENYFHVVTEDNEEVFLGTTLSYHLRPTARLDFSLDHRQRFFAEGGRSGDYSDSALTVALDVSPVFRHFETRYWYELEHRRPDQGDYYFTNSVGVTLAYGF